MDIWLEVIRENNLLKSAKPASVSEIEDAERKLGISFADDYKTLLSTVGACLCFGHEINGITDNTNLDVVSSTENARNNLDLIPHSWYVIENTHIDGIVILQDKNGTIFQMAPAVEPKRVTYSLESYLSESIASTGNRSVNPILNADSNIRPAVSEEAVKGILAKKYDEAREKLDKPDQVEKILQKLEKNLEKVPGVGDWLADVPAVISLVRSYIRKEYRTVPVSSIIAALAAILYLVSPIDLIPDCIPGVGMLDDAAVFVACWKMIHDDVDKYQEWRKRAGKEA